MDRHNRFLRLLSNIAQDVSPVGAARIASGLVLGNEFIAFGTNSMKTHPFQARFGKNSQSIHLHAEVDCIKNALKKFSVEELKKSTLYIARMKFLDSNKKHMVNGLACPCDGCKRAISTFNIRKVVFSLDNEGYGVL